MEDLTKYDVFTAKATMALVNDSIISRSGTDGFCHKLLNIAATLICDSKYNFQDLLKSAMDTSPEMSNVLTTVMHDDYNMMDYDMSEEDMAKLLSNKSMSYAVFKIWFSEQTKSEQLHIIKELLDFTY